MELDIYQTVQANGETKAYLGTVTRETDSKGRVMIAGKKQKPNGRDVFLSSSQAKDVRDVTSYENMTNDMRMISILSYRVGAPLDRENSFVPGDGVMVAAITEPRSSEENEWWLYGEEDKARRAAEEEIERRLEETPQHFNEGFLEQHIEKREGDFNQYVREEAYHVVDDWRYEGRERMEEEAESYGISGYEDMSDDRLQERLEQEYEGSMRDEIEREGLLYYAEFRYGWDVNDLFNHGLIQIDMDGAVEQAIREDGIGFFLDVYDFKPITYRWKNTSGNVKTAHAYGRN